VKQLSQLKAAYNFVLVCALFSFAANGHSQSYAFSTIVGQAGQRATVDGTNTSAHFYQPRCLTVDSSGNLFVTDDTTVRRITLLGTNYVVNTLAGSPRVSGGTDGTNGSARFNTPSGIAVDAATNLYVADYGNNTIRKITPIGTNWVVTTLAGVAGVTGSTDGTGTNALFNNPFGLSMDNASNLFVADSGNNTIREISPQGTNWMVTTVAGSSSHSGSTDGTNMLARFNTPRDVAVDAAGILYVTDRGNGTVREITPIGTNWIVTTIAGLAGQKATVDGTNATARFSAPDGIGLDGAGNLYVSDTTDDVIRQLTPVGTNWVVTTIGGVAGISGSTDGTGDSALFNYPDNIKVNSLGQLYVADRDNYVIRRGIITTNYVGTPIILTQPQRAIVFVGSTATFFVAAIGGGLNYQWRFNDVAIPDATNSVYALSNVSTNSAGNYSVGITNTYGFTNSQEAMLFVTPPLSPMLNLPGTGEDPSLILFTNLPVLNGAHALVSLGAAPWIFRLHNYLTFYGGKYWCMWSRGPAIEDKATQNVHYSTSTDGLNWSADGEIVGPPAQPNFRYIARGFWVRDDELLALASLDEADMGYFGPSLQLLAFKWDSTNQIWNPLGVVFDDAINNFPPQQLPTGEWAMVRRDHDQNVSLLAGGITSPLDWQAFDIAAANAAPPFLPQEPELWLLPDNRLLCVFRDSGGSKRLFVAVSTDNGRTWSMPQQSNFPDADAKFFGMRTSRGYYVLVSNADPDGRNPLCLSTSDDGVTFTRMARLPVPITPQGGPFDATGTSGTVQYPHVMEKDGQLFVAYSRNKTDIEIIKLSLDEVDRLRQGAPPELLLQYPFDEAGGVALDDGIAPQTNGVLVNLATRTNNTPSGTGLALDLSDGNHDYVSAGNPSKLNNLTNLTLTTWMNLRADPSANDRLLDKLASSAGFAWKMIAPTSGTFAASNFLFAAHINSTGSFAQSSIATGADHSWVFFAMTYDGTSTTNNLKFYSGTTSNSVVQLGDAVTLNAGAIINTTNDFRIGGTASTSSDRTPSAWFDDARIYSAVLDPAQLEETRLEGAPYAPTGLPFSVGAQTEAGQAVGLSWPSEAGRSYQVWTTDDLTSTNWVMFGTPVEGTGSTVTLPNIPTSGDAVRFFQVRRL
jgi:sugar lactone lactonase YvrE